ncbi:MAG: LacI family DNA-binding transcriptional regulator, partial [Oscillospiraceae bacterium]|nr:LacI family DNA-binding transcriptional regulator [Oscillospiraceae bacterium]
GTSNVTVSKALGGKRGVGDELREKIRRTAEEMGYTPTKPATPKDCGNVGVLIHEKFINMNGSFYWAVYNNILQQLKSRGISCLQENITSEEEQTLIMPKMLTDGKVDGVISLGQLKAEYVYALKQQNPKLLLMDYYVPDSDIDSVVTNGYVGGYKLTKYLISKGHKKIGYIGTRTATTSIFDRYMGYLKAMIENNLPVNDSWTLRDREPDGVQFSSIDFPAELPTAFVCNCDETAFTAIRSLKAKGLSIPDDISIVGYDNYLISEISEPSITTIDVDARRMAEIAVITLLARIADPSLPASQHTINGKLVEKNSVKAL